MPPRPIVSHWPTPSALAMVTYRNEHGLSRTASAAQLGWSQPDVARLERGDITPSSETMEHLASSGVIEAT